MKERSVIVQFSLMGLLYLILPLLLQFCNTLKATWGKHRPKVRQPEGYFKVDLVLFGVFWWEKKNTYIRLSAKVKEHKILLCQKKLQSNWRSPAVGVPWH